MASPTPDRRPRLLVPHPDPSHAFVLETAGADYAVAPFPAGVAISNRISLGTGWTRASAGLTRGDDFDRFRDHGDDTAQAMSAWRRAAVSRLAPPGGLTPAATAAHLRDHGTGPWGAPGSEGRCSCRPTASGRTPWREHLHARARASATAASMIAGLPAALADGAPLRVYVAAGSPCASIYVPAFPRTVAGPPPFVPLELSGEELWHAADALRQLVEADPAALPALRETLAPVEDELWAEARGCRVPARWADVGASWGCRALGVRSSSPDRPRPGDTLAPRQRAPTRQGGCHGRRPDH